MSNTYYDSEIIIPHPNSSQNDKAYPRVFKGITHEMKELFRHCHVLASWIQTPSLLNVIMTPSMQCGIWKAPFISLQLAKKDLTSCIEVIDQNSFCLDLLYCNQERQRPLRVTDKARVFGQAF